MIRPHKAQTIASVSATGFFLAGVTPLLFPGIPPYTNRAWSPDWIVEFNGTCGPCLKQGITVV
jgi:hypothetical protein